MNREQKTSLIRSTLLAFPNETGRKIAERLNCIGVDHKTVDKVRRSMIAAGSLEQTEKLTGQNGYQFPAPQVPPDNFDEIMAELDSQMKEIDDLLAD